MTTTTNTLAGNDAPNTDPRLATLADHWAVLLTTYKRDGSPVSTPVNIVVDGDHAFVRSYDKAWKSKRLARDPRVQVAPSTWRGTATGPSIPARARLLEGAEAERAGRLIDRKHPFFQGLVVRIGHRVLRYETLHFELRPPDR